MATTLDVSSNPFHRAVDGILARRVGVVPIPVDPAPEDLQSRVVRYRYQGTDNLWECAAFPFAAPEDDGKQVFDIINHPQALPRVPSANKFLWDGQTDASKLSKSKLLLHDVIRAIELTSQDVARFRRQSEEKKLQEKLERRRAADAKLTMRHERANMVHIQHLLDIAHKQGRVLDGRIAAQEGLRSGPLKADFTQQPMLKDLRGPTANASPRDQHVKYQANIEDEISIDDELYNYLLSLTDDSYESYDSGHQEYLSFKKQAIPPVREKMRSSLTIGIKAQSRRLMNRPKTSKLPNFKNYTAGALLPKPAIRSQIGRNSYELDLDGNHIPHWSRIQRKQTIRFAPLPPKRPVQPRFRRSLVVATRAISPSRASLPILAVVAASPATTGNSVAPVAQQESGLLVETDQKCLLAPVQNLLPTPPPPPPPSRLTPQTLPPPPTPPPLPAPQFASMPPAPSLHLSLTARVNAPIPKALPTRTIATTIRPTPPAYHPTDSTASRLYSHDDSRALSSASVLGSNSETRRLKVRTSRQEREGVNDAWDQTDVTQAEQVDGTAGLSGGRKRHSRFMSLVRWFGRKCWR